MVVGVLQLSLRIPHAMSLKDKRRVVKSIKDRLGARHNVSVAEIGTSDQMRACSIAVAMVSNEQRFIDSCLSKIAEQLKMHRNALLLDYEIEFF